MIKRKKNTIIIECRHSVEAAQTIASEAYGEHKYSDDELTVYMNTTAVDEINKLSENDGYYLDMTFSKAMLTYMIYANDDSKYICEYNDGNYTVSELSLSNYSAKYYTATSDRLYSSYDKQLTNATVDAKDMKKIIVNFLSANGNSLPALTSSEKAKLRVSNDSELYWKPVILADSNKNGVIALVSSKSSTVDLTTNYDSTLAECIYYNGEYYYHENGYGKRDTAYVAAGNISIENLGVAIPNKGIWVKAS